MAQNEYGLQIFDASGASVLEIGPHVIRDAPKFAEMIGIISAYWAQAEVNLNCLFALLLDVTPDEAAQQLKQNKYNSAKKVTCAARSIVNEHFTGAKLETVMNMLDQFDSVRERRNRIQHDVWAKKGGDIEKMFAVHAAQYLDITTRLIEVQKLTIPESEKAGQSLALAYQFAETVDTGYTIGDLQELSHTIDHLSQSFLSTMFELILQRAAKT